MSDAVIVALISLIGTLGGTFGGILVSNKLTNYRIQQLEKKVEEHNKVVARTYELERKEALVENKLDNISHDIEKLEGYHKGG